MKKYLLFALSALLAGCGDPSAPAETPTAGSLRLSRSELVFNAGGDVASDTRTLQLENTGTTTLSVQAPTIVGEDAARFALQRAAPFELAAGERLELALTFTPGSELGPHAAVLRLTSGGAEGSGQEVYLGGLSVAGQEGTKEPSLQWIFDTYGLPMQTGDTDPTTSAVVEGGTNSLIGDEVSAQTFERADGAQPVTVQVLAAFGVPDVEPVFEFGFYGAAAGEAVLQKLLSLPIAPALNGQRLEPVVTPAVAPAENGVISFDPPGGAFGFYSFWPTTRFFDARTVYTEDARNVFPKAMPHHVRAYPFKTRGGTLVENAYVLATDESARLFDYNDAVVLVRNVRPAGGM